MVDGYSIKKICSSLKREAVTSEAIELSSDFHINMELR